jgi:hypothetical protein
MIVKLNIILFFSVFLLIGLVTLVGHFVPIANALPTSQITQVENTIFLGNKVMNKSQINEVSNSTILKQLGLYPVYQQLNNTIASLMAIAENPLNGFISFDNFPLVDLTNEMKMRYHGIPSDQEIEKRDLAKDVLANNKALLDISLLLPNGDRYLAEPYYPYQTNGSVFNFAHRDHFKGVMETNKPYLSGVLEAVTTDERIAILASPIYSDLENQKSMVGIQILTLNFSYFNNLLQSAILREGLNNTLSNDTMVIVDSNGTKIAGSFSSSNDNKTEFVDLQSYKNAKDGESGSLVENINGRSMTISFAPVEFAQTKWILLSISPNY